MIYLFVLASKTSILRTRAQSPKRHGKLKEKICLLRKEKQNMWENNVKYIHIQLTHEQKNANFSSCIRS